MKKYDWELNTRLEENDAGYPTEEAILAFVCHIY